MADADAYQSTGPIKAAEISTNKEKVHQKTKQLNALAKAIAHLNAEIEQGGEEPEIGS